MIAELRKNIDNEIEILREISTHVNRREFADRVEKRLLDGGIKSLMDSMKIINSAIPGILRNVSAARRLPAMPRNTGLEKVQYKKIDYGVDVTISSKNREKFLKDLSISETLIRKIRKRSPDYGKEKYEEFKAARGYLKLSNKFFQNTAVDLINKGNFKILSVEIKKANIDILFETYVAMMLFTTFLSIFVGIFLFVFLMFFNISPVLSHLVTMYEGSYLVRLGKIFWIPFVVPVIAFLAIYYYPSTEKKTLSKQIDKEIPFAVIHMSAISGSGIEPSEIFKIIGFNKDYPYLRKEIRKVLNQINLYGYDLVTSVINVAKTTPSEKLSELFLGLATNIQSGGSLQTFFEKRSESLLAGYRLERERFSKTAEMFMDIYISVVIAAPMIMMLLLIMISISGLGIGLSPFQIALLIIGAISLINIVFLGFLHVKQPGY